MDAPPPQPDALTRLTPLGVRGGYAAIFVGLAASFFVLAYPLVYWRNADMDFMILHSVLLVNDGKPQTYFDHPAQLLIVLTAGWFKLLHALGLLQYWAMSTLPPASDPVSFDAALTQAVRAERLLAFLLGVGAVAGFAALMQRIVRDWRIVLLATFTFAFSGGIALHIGRLRSELLAAALALAALFILIAAARRATRSRPLLLGVAAFLCVAALTSKVHAILLIAAFPVLLLPFGSAESESVAPWRNFVTARAWLAGLAIVATASIFAAWPLIREGLDPQIVAAVPISRFLGLPYGIASTAIMIWLVAGSVVFAKVWRISAAETCTALLAIAVGAAIGLCVLWIDHHAYNAAAVINPLERMMSWAIDKQPEPAAGMLGAALLSDIVKALAHYTFVLAPSSRPTIFLAWLIVPAIVYAWRRGDRQIAMQALVLIAVAFALDMLGMRRGLKAEYWIFSDPLIILAGALLIEHYSRFRNLRFAFPVAVALFAAHIIVSQSASARTALLRRPPQPICEWNRLYLPAMPLHFCPQ